MASRAGAASDLTGRQSRPPAAAVHSSAFVSGRASDAFWILMSPVVALAVMAGLWKWSGLSDMAIFSVLFGFIVTGHHMPGWLRAFGEPAVYQRYKARLWVSLIAIPALVILPAYYGLGAVSLTIAAAFDLWHVAMQQHGFGRIYAAKAGDVSRRSARLDLVCTLTWYGTVVVWSDSWMEGISRALRKAGLPLFDTLTPRDWSAVKWALLAVSLALAAAYVANAVALHRRGIATPQKHLVHLVAFAVLIYSYQFASWYRAQSVQNLFHALQYFFLVWVYGHFAIARNPERPRGFYRALFERKRGIFLFGGLVALYGTGAFLLLSSGYRLTGADAERTVQIIGSIALTSLLLHFYVDSFIWKVRSKDVQTALAIGQGRGAGDGPPSSPPPVKTGRVPDALHAVAYFGIPILLVVVVGARSRGAPPRAEIDSVAHEAELFPRSAYAHFSYGKAALDRKDTRTARSELSEAVRLAPSFQGPARLLADLDVKEQDTAAEIEHAQAAVRAEPADAELRFLLANALAREKRFADSEEQYRDAIRLRPRYAGAFENLGVLYKWQNRLDEAVPIFRRAHELDPNLSPAACDLAGALATQGDIQGALDVLTRYRQAHPEDRAAADLQTAITAEASRH
jgi:Tfp pilus assembly protein PilF